MTERTFVFITGCPRSGTSAVHRLLNRHPEVAIGNERYSGQTRRQELRPALYEPDRFLAFEEGDTHHMGERWKRRDDRGVLERFRGARIVGDKLPQLIGKTEQLAAFGRVKLVFLLREPFGVANSFDLRAAKKDRFWPETRDHKAAIRQFNKAMKTLKALEDEGVHELLVMPYEHLFVGQRGLRELFAFIGADFDQVGEIDDIFAQSDDRRAAGRGANLTAQFVSLRANFEGYRQAMAHALARLETEPALPDMRSTT
ncbi:MAG: sulfotransferase [Pseudomonadota bacterium]